MPLTVFQLKEGQLAVGITDCAKTYFKQKVLNNPCLVMILSGEPQHSHMHSSNVLGVLIQRCYKMIRTVFLNILTEGKQNADGGRSIMS